MKLDLPLVVIDGWNIAVERVAATDAKKIL
jgi:hypothetical protein